MAKAPETLERPLPDGSAQAVTADEERKAPAGRKRRILIPLIAAAVLIGTIFLIRYLVFSAHHVTTDDAQITGDITTVAPRVKGEVIGVYVTDNQTVRKGTILVRLDPRDY